MAISDEEFETMMSAIHLASWNVQQVYSEILDTRNADLSDDQKAVLKKAYDIREFYRDEIFSHLPYDLIAKAGPEENLIRNSITKMGFLNNNYQFNFIAADDSGKIEAWKTANKDNPNISVLIIQPMPAGIMSSMPRALVLSDSVVVELKLTSLTQLDGIIPSPAGEEIVELPNEYVCRRFLAESYKQNGLHIPFKFYAKNDREECFVPNREGSFSWKQTAVSLADQTYVLCDVKRFSRDVTVSASAEVEPVAAGAGRDVTVAAFAEVEPVAAGAGAGVASASVSDHNWVNLALKCFVLLPSRPDVTGVKVLWAGTHDRPTLAANTESSAGHESFSKHRGDFIEFMKPIIIGAASAVSSKKTTIMSFGHSLGGALAQLSTHAILDDETSRGYIGSFTIAVKNPTGIPNQVVSWYEKLVNDNPELKHKTRFYFVEGDAIQQTGDGALLYEDKVNFEVSFCKIVNRTQELGSNLGNVGVAALNATAILTAGAAAAVALAPAAGVAAATYFCGVAAGVGAVIAGSKAIGAVSKHSCRYFGDGLRECKLVYYNADTKEGFDRIRGELGIKSTAVAMLHSAYQRIRRMSASLSDSLFARLVPEGTTAAVPATEEVTAATLAPEGTATVVINSLSSDHVMSNVVAQVSAPGAEGPSFVSRLSPPRAEGPSFVSKLSPSSSSLGRSST